MIGHAMAGAASFTIYTRTKEFFRDHHLIDHRKLLGCATVGGIAGAMAGSLISFGSAREFLSSYTPHVFYYFLIFDERRSAFELVKVKNQVSVALVRINLLTMNDDAFAGRFGGSWNIRLQRRKESSW